MVSSSYNLEKDEGKSENGSISVAEDNQKPESEEEKSTYKIRIEFAAVLFSFGVNLAFAAFQDEVMNLSCTVVYGYNQSVCDDVKMGKGKSDSQIQAVENIVQPLTANIFLAESFVKTIIPAVLALFIGSWTDKFGRKPVILITLSGFLCYSSIKAIIAALSLVLSINPWMYIIASIPVSVCGGDVILRTAFFCYVADLTTTRERPFRMCVLTATMGFSGIIAQVASGYLYAATTAWAVFAISAATKALGILYVTFIIKESVTKDQLSSDSKIKGFCDGQLLKDMFKTLMKKRDHFETPLIWCIITLIVMVSFDNSGIGDLYFLFLRKKFGWNVEEVTVFNAWALVITYLGAALGIYILQYKLRIRLTIMAFIVFLSCIGISVVFGTSFSPLYLYIGMTITCFSGAAIPIGQSMLSNVASPSDIGKVFTFVSAVQSIVPLISAPLYTLMYNKTIDTFPSAYNFIGAGLYTIGTILVVFIHFADKRYPKINVDKSK